MAATKFLPAFNGFHFRFYERTGEKENVVEWKNASDQDRSMAH